jgi:prolyl 4-hydroxylase
MLLVEIRKNRKRKTKDFGLSYLSSTRCCGMTIERFLSAVPLPGYHICHFSSMDDCITVKAYRNSSGIYPVQFSESLAVGVDGNHFRAWIEAQIGIVAQTNDWPVEKKQPWSFFSPTGIRLSSVQEVLQSQEVFILEGGQFIWPPVRIGHITVLPDIQGDDGKPLELETMSIQPIVFQVCHS